MSLRFAKATKSYDRTSRRSPPHPPRNLLTSQASLSTFSTTSSRSSATSYSEDDAESPAEISLLKAIKKHNAKYAEGRVPPPDIQLKHPFAQELSKGSGPGFPISNIASPSVHPIDQFLNDPGDALKQRLLRTSHSYQIKGSRRIKTKNKALHGVQVKGDDSHGQNGDVVDQPEGNGANARNNASQNAGQDAGLRNLRNGKDETDSPGKGDSGNSNGDERAGKTLKPVRQPPDHGLSCFFYRTSNHKTLCEGPYASANKLHPHLEHKHGFFNEGNVLAAGSHTNDTDLRNGLCKVCYQCFGSFLALVKHVDDHGKHAHPDKHRPAELKYDFMRALFTSGKSVADIQAQYAPRGIPFKKNVNMQPNRPANRGLSQLPLFVAAKQDMTPASRVAPGQARSVSGAGSTSKRPCSPEGEGFSPTHARKHYRPHSGRMPSLVSAASTTESGVSSNIDPGLDTAILTSRTWSQLPPQINSFKAARTAGTALKLASDKSPSSIPVLLPADDEFVADLEGGATVLIVHNHGDSIFFPHYSTTAKVTVTGPLLGTYVTILSDGSMVTKTGRKATARPNGDIEFSYDEAYDTSNKGTQSEESNEQVTVEMED